MEVLNKVICPKCKSSMSNAVIMNNQSGKRLQCGICKMEYAMLCGAIDFASVETELSTENWSREEFEEHYKDLGDWDSIYDWDRKRGIPEQASKYKYKKIKGKLLEMMEPQEGQHILDLGCGNGYFLLEMLDRFSSTNKNLRFFGLDASKHNISNFQKKLDRKNVINISAFVGRGEMLPFEDNSLNWITCSEVLEHIEDKQLAINEVYRVLANGGKFLFSTPSDEALRNWKFVLYPFMCMRRLMRSKRKEKSSTEDGRINMPYDQPITTKEYMKIFRQSGFKYIQIDSGQMLNDDVVRRIPESMSNAYTVVTDMVERNIPIARNIFGLHLVGLAVK